MQEFLERLKNLPHGYSRGKFESRVYGVTVNRSPDNRRMNLFAEDLSGSDIVSFNLYFLNDGQPILKPCEMSRQKVVDFVLNFEVTY